MTAFNSKEGGFFLTTVGRVQTPTLTIVVEREEKIRKFVPRNYWEVRAEFVCAAGLYEGKYINPQFKKDEFDPEKKAERVWSLAEAEAIVAACRDKTGKVSEEAKPTTSAPPLLYDLTSLQREANARFGFSASTTLSLAQALYERHKVLTYPRTDSRYLPDDYLPVAKQTLEALDEQNNYALFARQALNKGYVKPNKRIFDQSKVSDHFAIIPTLQAPKSLNEIEYKLYDMVVRRFLAVFFPAAEYLVTTRDTEVAGFHFKTEGKILVKPGWLEVYGKEAQDDDATLVPVAKDEKVKTDEVHPHSLTTKPPARYSEATLLSAMESAGKLVDDEELRDAMAGKGLGTPATRAATIEGLISEKYMVREGRELIPTAKAFQLLTLLRGLGVAELTQPELTGEWEYKLGLIEKGQLKRDEFMHTPCPKCGSVVKENYRRFACTSCDFSISKIPGGRQFELPEVEELLQQKTIGPLQGFRSKMGRPFAAILKITDEHKLEFDFGQDKEDESGEAIDFSAQTALGDCPKCGSHVYENGMSYVCEKSVGPNKSCDFRSGKVILQQEITSTQMQKLLADGKTDLLDGFVSSRTKRKFKAYLVKGEDGKVSFEFEPRAPKAAKAGAKSAEKATTKTAPKTTAKTVEKKAAPKKAVKAKTKASE